MVNDEEYKKRFAVMIADAIQHLVRESDELTMILDEAHDEGYDILLSIFSGIMIRRRESHLDGRHPENEQTLPLHFDFTERDKTFLRSIGIQVH